MPPMAEALVREQPSEQDDTCEAAGGDGPISLTSLELQDGGCCQAECQQLRLRLQEELEASQVRQPSICTSTRAYFAL